MPRRVVFSLVEHAATTGTWTKNPFNFQHFNLKSLKLMVAGHANPYREPHEMDYATRNYTRAYLSLFKGLGGLAYENGLDISYDDYADGYALYARLTCAMTTTLVEVS